MNTVVSILTESWHLLLDSSVYIIFGLLISGLLKVFLNPAIVSRHLGSGRISSVLKAAALGVPIPLCSCGVMPAAASLRKQGANKGAVTAFLISTPESGVDSISISWALLDPIMTITRPVVGFITAAVAGITENLFPQKTAEQKAIPDLSCPVDGCCDGRGCPDEIHKAHHTFSEKASAGFRFAFREVWGDIASWFLFGIILAGLISVILPESIFSDYLGGGISAMLIMLAVGIPLYICATASTPVAAALILKGVSPGAALVFLIAGPATNIASLTVLTGILGRRSVALYLVSISVMALFFGLTLDGVYAMFGISAQASIGTAAEIIPFWAQLSGAVFLLLLSVKPLSRSAVKKLSFLLSRNDAGRPHSHTHTSRKDNPSSKPGST